MSKKFEFPTQVLDQINECSTAFLLVAVNEQGEFNVYENANKSPIVHLGMLAFLEYFINKEQDRLLNSTDLRDDRFSESEDKEEED